MYFDATKIEGNPTTARNLTKVDIKDVNRQPEREMRGNRDKGKKEIKEETDRNVVAATKSLQNFTYT